MFNPIVLERLGYTLESLQIIIQRFEGINTAADFVASDTGIQIMDSIAMRLQIIGENSKRVEKEIPDFFEKYLQTDAEPIIRFRDFISHHYEKTDYEIIFDICKNHIPPLLSKIYHFLQENS